MPARNRETRSAHEPMSSPTETPALVDQYRDRVRPEWIDENEHMNMGYYVVVFDYATDAFFDYLGLDAEHKQTHHVTTFCLETHVNYLRELRAGDTLRFTTQLLGFDAKRMHYFHQMWHADEGYLAATNELMSLHVSQDSRRGAKIAPQVLRRLTRVAEAQRELPVPPQAGRRIGLDAKPDP